MSRDLDCLLDAAAGRTVASEGSGTATEAHRKLAARRERHPRADVIKISSPVHVVNAGDGDDLICGSSGKDYINGGYGKDRIYAGKTYDVVHGNAGNDHLYGERGGDALRGEAGRDQIYPGPGPDFVDGGDGSDTIHSDGNGEIEFDGADHIVHD